MDFRFENFVEHWCSIYKPLQHVPGERSKNKRFFLTDTTYLGMSDFMNSINARTSSCVVMESSVEGTVKGGIDTQQHTIYFFAKAKSTQDGFDAREAMLEAKGYMTEFLAYLRAKQREGMPELQRINLDERNGYMSIGPLLNNWYGVYLTIEDVRQVKICVDKDNYINE